MGVELGDFNGADLREKLASGDTLKRIVSDVVQFAGKRKGLLFADSVENAERITELLNTHQHGCARILTGETEKTFERPALMEAYKDRQFQWLVNVGVAERGFDVPDIQCIALTAPTCSITKQTQQLGRGTRTWPGTIDSVDDLQERRIRIARSQKPNLLVLDLIKNYSRRRLPTVTSIIGGDYSDEIVDFADKAIRYSLKVPNVADVLEYVQRKHNDQILADAKEKERLRLRSKSASTEVDPFGYYGLVREPSNRLSHPMTKGQADKLAAWNIKHYERLDYDGAAQIINDYRERRRNNRPTPNMDRLLKKRGYDTDYMSIDEASEIIGALAANGWKPISKRQTVKA